MIRIFTQYDLKHDAVTEDELDDALNEGFRVIAVLPGWGGINDMRREGMIVLYKPDDDPYGNNEAMMQDYRDIQSERNEIRTEAGANEGFSPPDEISDIPF